MRSKRLVRGRAALAGTAVATALALAALSGAGSLARAAADSADSAAADAPASSSPPDIVRAPTLVARTADGDAGYREVGHGSPILLITGLGTSMDSWDPAFVDALAADHRVIVFDNAGVGDTSALPGPLTITGMARQESAFITALHLHHPAVLGWSMGGMIAEALAVLRPGQVGRLILAATQPGNGAGLPIPQAALDELGSTNLATVLGLLFPADQDAAGLTYFEDIFQYPGFYAAPAAVASAQLTACLNWIAGDEPAGYNLRRIHVPTLVADGDEDAFDPIQNDELLATLIPHARLKAYPDAGHAFLFQDASAFIPLVDQFLGHPRR